jgi:DNA repair protein RecO (recombination protein O)
VPLYRDVGVVLRTYKLGEADRIVVLCTQGHGKVRAVAKGVRKTNSKFGSRLEPTSHILVQLHEGRGELHTVTQAELVETFDPLRRDLERLSRAVSMLEAVDQVSQEGKGDASLYEMLVKGLRACVAWDSPLVGPSFFLRLLESDGVGLIVDRCVVCDRTDELVAMDLDSGGLRCVDHREGVALSREAVLLLQLMSGGRISQALSLPVGAATWEVDHLAGLALETHLGRRLRALRLLDGA